MTIGDERRVIKGIKKSKRVGLFLVSYFAGTLHKYPLEFKEEFSYKRQIQLQVPLVFISQFETHLKSSGEGTFFLESLSCMFKAVIQSFDSLSGQLCIAYPKKIVFHERRENARVVLNSDLHFLYNLDSGGVIRKRVYDLSMGGVSLAFSQVESLRVQEGDLLKNVCFQYGAMVQFINVKVLRILKPSPFELESMPYAFRRVSFAFVDLDDEQKIFIKNILESESGLQKKKSS